MTQARADLDGTVSIKAVLVVGLVLLALAVAYLLGDSGGTPSAQAAAPAAPAAEDDATDPPRTLTMRGVGEASVVPDEVGFDVSVRLMRGDLDRALAASNTVLERVLTRLEELGVPKGDTETTSLDINPVYDYVDDAPPVLRGYRVSQSVTVLVRELDDAGAAISAVVAEGGNEVRVNDISLRVGDPEEAIGRARTDAVEAATAKAEQYAAATGQQLGEVMTLVEVDPERVYSQVEAASNAFGAYDAVSSRSSLAALPIRTGRSQLDVTVQVVWQLA